MGRFRSTPSVALRFHFRRDLALFRDFQPCDAPEMPSVAILGASSNRTKFGNKAVRAFHECGWEVFPVNRREASIEGFACIPGADALPTGLDVVSAYLPPAILLSELKTLAQKGCSELWLNPGTDTDEVITEARRLGLHVIQDCSILRLGRRPQDYP
jgi:hypothetical protein